jgi:hypothetical protein
MLKSRGYLPSLSGLTSLFFAYPGQTWRSTAARDKDIESGSDTGSFSTLKTSANAVINGIIYKSWGIFDLQELSPLMASQLEMLLQVYFTIQNTPNLILSGMIDAYAMPSEIYGIAHAYPASACKGKTYVCLYASML